MKKILVASTLVLLLAAGCSKNNDTSNSTNTQSTQTTNQSTNTNNQTPATTTTPKKVAPAPTAAYTAALKAYGTNRIQFDENCSAIPKAVAFKGGTKIMIDNRDDVAKKIVVGSVTQTVGAYSYSFVTLPTTTVSKPVGVGCGSLTNVATITLNR